MREGRRGRNGDRNYGRGGMRKRGGQRGMGSKMSPLIEDVLEYWEAYKGLVPIMFDTYNICNGRNGGL